MEEEKNEYHGSALKKLFSKNAWPPEAFEELTNGKEVVGDEQ